GRDGLPDGAGHAGAAPRKPGRPRRPGIAGRPAAAAAEARAGGVPRGDGVSPLGPGVVKRGVPAAELLTSRRHGCPVLRTCPCAGQHFEGQPLPSSRGVTPQRSLPPTGGDSGPSVAPRRALVNPLLYRAAARTDSSSF